MTKEEIDNMKYKICCPMCDNKKCVKSTNSCEAEQWAKNKAKSEGEGKPLLWWKCERCGKLIPYMADFCHECADELFGEPPKPFEPQESEE